MHKDGRALIASRRLAQMLRQAVPEEHIVAEHERGTLAVEKIGANEKGLSETAWLRLLRIAQLDAPLRAVAEQAAEQRRS